MKRISKSYFLIFIILFSGFISTNKILNQPPSEIDNFSFNAISGSYLNEASNKTFTNSLWKTLYECKSLHKDTTNISKNTIVNLSFNEQGNLIVKAISDSVELNSIELKGKIYEDYFSMDRKLILIPFPFIYYRISERKVFLGSDSNGNLIVKSSLDEFLWIFIMSGGHDWISSEKYQKQITD